VVPAELLTTTALLEDEPVSAELVLIEAPLEADTVPAELSPTLALDEPPLELATGTLPATQSRQL